MAGEEDDALRVLAVRERHAQSGGGRQPGSDAVDHLHGDAGGQQVFALLAAAAEDEGVAALQPHDVLALARRQDHQPLDEGLRRALAAAALAHVHDARTRGRMGHDLLTGLVVVRA